MTSKSGLNENLDDLVAESLSKIKEIHHSKFITSSKVEKLKSRISVLETDLNKQDEYNRCNNLDIQRIPGSVPGNQLE